MEFFIKCPRIRARMVLDKLSKSLKTTLSKITKAVFVDEKLINEVVKDIQRSLLQSDVNVKLVLQISQKIKERAMKEQAVSQLTRREQLINIVYDELVQFLGGPGSKISIKKKPFIILLVGLFGNGKTTSAGKMGKYFSTRGKKVALMSTDTWRPAATDQLSQLAKKVNVEVFTKKEEKNPVKIFNSFKEKLSKYDVVVVDTAGRDALSEDLIEELNAINKAVKPDEVLLVMSADIGQSAQEQAQKFHDTCNVTGVVITKLDGTAKGGGALIACSVTGAPVKFIGVGEKIDDIEEFKPEGFVGRLLGMGDLEALLEKAKAAIPEDRAEDMGRKFLKGDFNLLDLYEQMSAMKKMGPLNKVMKMIPGIGGMEIPKEVLDGQEGKIEKWKFLMDSMTKEELEDPDTIHGTRIDRIAKGSGQSPSEVRGLLKQYKQSKKMMKMFKGSDKNMEKMMKKFQSGQLRMK